MKEKERSTDDSLLLVTSPTDYNFLHDCVNATLKESSDNNAMKTWSEGNDRWRYGVGGDVLEAVEAVAEAQGRVGVALDAHEAHGKSPNSFLTAAPAANDSDSFCFCTLLLAKCL